MAALYRPRMAAWTVPNATSERPASGRRAAGERPEWGARPEGSPPACVRHHPLRRACCPTVATVMSTRRLIIAALACGLAILVAFSVQLVLATR